MVSLRHFFLLSDQHTPNGAIPNWRISALRIILTLVMLLCFFISFHTFHAAIQSNMAYLIGVTLVFSTASASLLIFSRRFYTVCAHGLLIAIVGASVAMNLFLTDIELAKTGSTFMYSSPVVALMLLGWRTSIFYGVINVIPFYMIINNVDISVFTGVSGQLPEANWYISGLLFLFFNICIPLTVARTIVAAKRLNNAMLESNDYLKAKNQLYKTFFTESNKAKIIVDNQMIITDFNQQAKKLFSFKNNQTVMPLTLYDLHPLLKDNSQCGTEQVIQYQNKYLRVGCICVLDCSYSVYDFYDCTQEQIIKQNLLEIEQENKRLRYCDTQTQLPNREWFEMQCDKVIAKYQKGFFIVVTQSADSEYLNLKLTKTDSQALLKSAYKRIKTMAEGPLLCAHIGGGQLAFIIGSQSKNELSNKWLADIQHVLNEEYTVFGELISQAFVFGYASYPEHGKGCSIVLRNACEALKLANCNEPFKGYNEKLSQAFLEKHEISMLLDEALQNSEIDVFYQPKVTTTGQCIGLEALARWNSPVLGGVSPGVFVPIAEEYRMVSRLTDLVIQKVCAQLAQWAEKGVQTVPIAINISLIDFSQSDFMSKLVKYLADFNIKPNQIELELTETSLEANQEHSLELIKTLQMWGFTISVDDFGMGYSNIARLADYPINKLKLDRSLISQVNTSKRQKSLVKAIHAMCEELDIKCVSEGVETEEQVSTMAAMGCKEFQGFYFAKPMPAKILEEHLVHKGLKFNKKTLVSE
jgi:EAL domain-containing protein (putative c-di-GMP-specific phosphodiesterase class I)/GGDEF domain-containing protein